jgi:outer membrane lipoprotein-sorting protein
MEPLMRVWNRVGVAAIFLAAFCAAVHAQTPSVDEIVARTLAARGGADKIRAVTTMKMSGTVTVQDREIPLSVMTKRPNLMLQEITIDGTRVVSAFDGEKVWAINPMIGANEPKELSGPQADQIRDQSTFDGPLVGYKERGDTLELAGSADIAGDTWKLKLTRKNGRTMFIYVDKESGFEKQWSTTVDQNGMTIDIDTVMTDYQPAVNGIFVARTLRTLVGGKQQGLLKVLTIAFNTPIDDALFKMPTKPDQPD